MNLNKHVQNPGSESESITCTVLAAKDINVNQAHGLFGTPLDIATKNNHTEIIQLLKDAEVQSK